MMATEKSFMYKCMSFFGAQDSSLPGIQISYPRPIALKDDLTSIERLRHDVADCACVGVLHKSDPIVIDYLLPIRIDSNPTVRFALVIKSNVLGNRGPASLGVCIGTTTDGGAILWVAVRKRRGVADIGVIIARQSGR